MGRWYRVTKKIHGRFYDYWQRTERQGKSVKTFNKYIGPVGGASNRYSQAPSRLFSESYDDHDFTVIDNPDHTYSFNARGYTFRFTNIDEARASCDELKIHIENIDAKNLWAAINRLKLTRNWSNEPGNNYGKFRQRTDSPELYTPEDALRQLDPLYDPEVSLQQRRNYEKVRQKEILDWESVKYGSVRSRNKRAAVKLAAAKKRAKGSKYVNPFLGQAIKKK